MDESKNGTRTDDEEGQCEAKARDRQGVLSSKIVDAINSNSNIGKEKD
jgi:hypothetical protein